jgi:hypothetical protein
MYSVGPAVHCSSAIDRMRPSGGCVHATKTLKFLGRIPLHQNTKLTHQHVDRTTYAPTIRTTHYILQTHTAYTLYISTLHIQTLHKMGSVVLPHLPSGWHVDQAILSEEDRLVVIRFGRDWDADCMKQDEVLYRITDRVKNFAVIYLCDLDQVPDFKQMYVQTTLFLPP